MNGSLRLGLGLVLVFTCALADSAYAGSPSPDDEAKAKKLFDQANVAFEAKRFADALEMYRQSFAKVPRPNVLFNMARAEEELGDYAAAWMDYRRFLQVADPDARRRPDATAKLTELEGKIELSVQVESVPVGAAVTLDADPTTLGITPLTLRVRPGQQHRLRLTAPGRPSREIEFAARIGVENRLQVVLEPAPADAGKARDPVPDAVDTSQARIVVSPNVPGALVFVDALPVQAHRAHNVTPGDHAVSVESEGYVPWRRRIRVVASTTVAVRLARERSPTLRVGVWGLGGSGVAAVALGGILGVLALRSEADYEELPQRSVRERADRQALWSDVLLGGGAAALVSAFVLHRVTRTESTATIAAEPPR